MSETRPRPRPRDRVADLTAPIPYRATEGLQVTTTSKGQGGSPTHFVRSRKGEVVQLGDEEYLLFTLLDGQPSFADIQREFKARFAGDLSRKHFQSFIEELLEAGIIERSAAEAPDEESVAKPPPIARQAEPADTEAASDLPLADEAMADTAPALPVAAISLLPLFLLIARLGAPLRYFQWLLVVAVPVAGIALFDGESWLAGRLATLDWSACGAALHEGTTHIVASVRALDGTTLAALPGMGVRRIEAALTVLHRSTPHLVRDAIAALLACWLIPRIAEGAAAAYHGAPRETFRPRRSAWVLPRFPVDRAGIEFLPRKGRASTYAAPLLARLGLFVIGAALFAPYDRADGRIAVTALLLGLFAIWSFLLSAAPFWPGGGRRWVAAYFDEPALNLGFWRARRAGPVRGRFFLAAASVISMAAIAGALLPWAGLVEASRCW